MARRACLEPDGRGGEHRLVDQDASALEGKTDRRCCSHVFAAGGCGELSLVDPALAGHEPRRGRRLRVECVGLAASRRGRQDGPRTQLLDPRVDGRRSKKRRRSALLGSATRLSGRRNRFAASPVVELAVNFDGRRDGRTRSADCADRSAVPRRERGDRQERGAVRAEEAEFVCECADPACAERVRPTLEEYEEVRSAARTSCSRPVTRPEVERVVERPHKRTSSWRSSTPSWRRSCAG